MTTLATTHAGLVLTSLVPEDADALHALLAANREHLMRWGDYSAEIDTSVEEWRSTLSGDRLDLGLRDGDLVGRIVLIDHFPRFGLGYWVSSSHTGRGYATAAVGAIVSHARDTLGGSDIFAGVSLGNAASARVLRRNGFSSVAVFETYERFHLPLSST